MIFPIIPSDDKPANLADVSKMSTVYKGKELAAFIKKQKDWYKNATNDNKPDYL